MKNFTLKVIRDNTKQVIVPDEKHYHGGIDAEQIIAFQHLIPEGFIDLWREEDLFNLADMHGWEVEIKNSWSVHLEDLNKKMENFHS